MCPVILIFGNEQTYLQQHNNCENAANNWAQNINIHVPTLKKSWSAKLGRTLESPNKDNNMKGDTSGTINVEEDISAENIYQKNVYSWSQICLMCCLHITTWQSTTNQRYMEMWPMSIPKMIHEWIWISRGMILMRKLKDLEGKHFSTTSTTTNLTLD